MVDREHVPRAEPAAEQVDDECQQGPPRRGAAEEPGDDEQRAHESPEGVVGHFAARDFEDGEEGQDIGDHHDEVGDRESEDRDEILPQRGFAGSVAAYLRHGVLGEDEDPDDHDENAADDPQQRVVLLDPGLEHRVEEQRGHSHERIGAGDADSRDDSRTAAFRQGPLDAEHRHGTYRDGSGHTYADAAEQGFDDFQCHFSGS